MLALKFMSFRGIPQLDMDDRGSNPIFILIGNL